MSDIDYSTIANPYDPSMNRQGPLGSINNSSSTNNVATNSIDTSIDPNLEATAIIKSGTTISDIFIENSIRSRAFQPKTQGFLIDARQGFIECMKLFVGTGGIIGGSLDIPDQTSTGSFHVDAQGNMWIGATTFAAAPFSVTSAGGGFITGGTIQTEADNGNSNPRMVMSGPNNSYEFLAGDVVIGEMKAEFVPFSGDGGIILQHGTQSVGVNVSGQNIGGGNRQFGIFTAPLEAYNGYFNVVDLDGQLGLLETNLRMDSDWLPYDAATFHLGNSTYPWKDIFITNNTATSTHFNPMINMDGTGAAVIIWKSDGTTPNGNLSGSAGDICLGADGGKAYYCTGTTNWTAM